MDRRTVDKQRRTREDDIRKMEREGKISPRNGNGNNNGNNNKRAADGRGPRGGDGDNDGRSGGGSRDFEDRYLKNNGRGGRGRDGDGNGDDQGGGRGGEKKRRPAGTNNKKGRSIVEKHHVEGLIDEGALHSIQQASDKATVLKTQLSKAGSRVSEEQVAEIAELLEDYMQAERVVAFSRQEMSKLFHDSKQIEDKEERKAYLDGLKEQKEERKEEDKAVRDVAKEKYLAIKAKVDAMVSHHEL